MERTDWAHLEYSYEEAPNVPELIRTAAFGDDEQACKACSTLHDNIVHQSSIYSSTSEAIPFLIEALAVTGRASMSRLLVLHLLGDIVKSSVHWIEMESDPEFALGGQEPWPLPRNCIEQTWLGSELFARLLQDDDNADVRILAAYLLGMLLTLGPGSAPTDKPDRYGSAVVALISRLEGTEADELARSSVIFALGRGIAYDSSLIASLRKMHGRPDVGELTRVAAALAVMEIDDGKHASLREVDLLIDTMCRAEETDTLFDRPPGIGRVRQSPWIIGRLRFTLRKALCAWSAGNQERMERVLPALLTGVRSTSGLVAEADLGPVFQWLWPDRCRAWTESPTGGLAIVGPPPIAPKDLTGVSRRVLQACYDNPRIWQPSIGNTALAFCNVGLPETRAGLKDLLDRAHL
jgi:hypothetical protein